MTLAPSRSRAPHVERTGSTSRGRRYPRATVLRLMVLLPLAVAFVLPLVIVVAGAGRPGNAVLGSGLEVLDPQGFRALGRNLKAALAGSGSTSFAHALQVSLIVSVSTVLLGLVVNSLAGYALARLPFRGRRGLLAAVLALLVVPFEAIAVPLLLLCVQPVGGLRLSDSLLAQVLPFVAQPFHVFLFYSFFRGVPVELDEAAQLDGAGAWRTFVSVVAPQAGPAYLSSAILMFLQSWGQFMWPLMVAGDRRELQPLPLGLWNFNGTSPDWGGFYAYTLLMITPVILVFLALQRWFVQGVTTSGVKG